jgi:predicted transcriptional regulator
MSVSDLPEEVRQFISEYIQTVGALDLLILLKRSPSRLWSLDEIAQELRTSAIGVAGFLANFITSGLVSEHDGSKYSYNNTANKLDSVVNNLAHQYSLRPVAVVNAIYSTPSDKIQTFADAFKFKKS